MVMNLLIGVVLLLSHLILGILKFLDLCFDLLHHTLQLEYSILQDWIRDAITFSIIIVFLFA